MIHIVAAVAENYVIGNGTKIPWRIPADFDHFKSITMGEAVVMGRITYAAISKKSRPLPGRDNVVISRDFEEEGSTTLPSLEAALKRYPDIAFCGGEQIYLEGLYHAEYIDISHIPLSPEGDKFFPKLDWSRFPVHDEKTFEGKNIINGKENAEPVTITYRSYNNILQGMTPEEMKKYFID